MREYETIYIVRPSASDKEVQEIQERLERLTTKLQGKILSHRTLGKKALAFPLRGEQEGIYLQINYSGHGQIVTEVEQALRYNERVFRFLTTALPKEKTKP